MESLIYRRSRTTIAQLFKFIKYSQSRYQAIPYHIFSYCCNTNATKNISENPSDRYIFRTFLCTSQSAVKPQLLTINNKSNNSRLLHSMQNTENEEEYDSLQMVENDEKKQEAAAIQEKEEKEEGLVNEFLERFVTEMRSKLSEAYPHAGRDVVDGMLEIIVSTVIDEMEKGTFSRFETFATNVSSPETRDFSQDLWKIVWEVSNSIVEDMQNTQVKIEIQGYLQSDEMKEFSAFAKVVGVTGNLLRDMKMYFAEQKKEEIEFKRKMDRLAGRDFTARLFGSDGTNYKSKLDDESAEGEEESTASDGEKKPGIALPQRHATLKLKAYGLDLSKPSWTEIGQRLEEANRKISPEEPSVLSGKAKAITKQVLSLSETEDPSELLTEWMENVKPRRVDWLALLQQLDELKKKDLHFKAAEFTLHGGSFEATVRDYTKLLDSYAKENRFEDAERILQVMKDKGFSWDAVTCSVLIDMYSKLGNLDRAKEAFEQIWTLGLQPDQKAYSLMIKAYLKAGLPEKGESLMREMEAKDMKPGKEVYLELLRAFAQNGQVRCAQRIFNFMHFTGIMPNLESYTFLVEAYGQYGNSDQARNVFDHMIKAGHKPDDKCTSKMLAAYESKNCLDKALTLMLDLEKDGFKMGVETSTILIDWLGKLGLVDEAEQVFVEIATNEVPSKVHVSLCDMYARAGLQKKALDMLGNLEDSIQSLNSEAFEKLIHGLLSGGLIDEAKRINDLVKKHGLIPSEPVEVALMAAQAFSRKKPTGR